MATHYNKGNIMTMVETTRQRLGFKKGDLFEPTPNVRNPRMLEEAEAFSPQLRAFERAVRDYHRHCQGFLGSLLPLLEENLPRVWTAVSGGLAEPVRSQISHGHPSRIGGDFSAPLILERLELLNRGMEEDILAPLRRWQEGLGIAKERMKSLEGLRSDVDKERRKAEKRFKRQEAKLRRAYLGAGYGSSSSSSSSDYEDNDYVVPRGRLLEDYQRLALHTERHLNALMESYRDQERLLWEQLSGLVTDAAWLESYAAAAMLKVKETMQAVALALGPCKQPLPAFRHAAYPFDGQYGQIGHNIELIKGFGPRARELASGAKPAGADYLPYTALRAKRGVSTPLMVGAAAGTGRQQQRLAMEPVPPVQVGASAIPLESVPTGMRETAIRRVEERAMGSGTRVADMPALPPALTPEPTSGTTASRLSPLTPGSTAATTTTVRGSSSGGGYGGSSSALAPVTAGRTSNMRSIPEGPSTTSTTRTTAVGSNSGSKGIVARATEAAGAAAGSVAGAVMAPAAAAAGAARGAAESFREGVAEGEAAGNRDVARAELATERARERVSADSTTGVSAAPLSGGRLSSSSTTITAPISSSTGMAGRGGGLDMVGNGASSGTAAAIASSSARAGAGPLYAAAGAGDAPAATGSGSGMGAELQPGTQIVAGTAASETAGPMSAAGGVTDSPRMSEMPAAGMSERGAGVSDVTGETPGMPSEAATAPTAATTTATAAAAAAAAVEDDGMDSFVSALKGPLSTGTSSVTGLKHQQRTMAAAPAGYDDPATTYSKSQTSAGYGGEGRLVGEQQQQQGGGGLIGAVKRAVGV